MVTAIWVLGGFLVLVLWFRFSNWLIWGRHLKDPEIVWDTPEVSNDLGKSWEQQTSFGASGFTPGPVSWTMPDQPRARLPRKGRKK